MLVRASGLPRSPRYDGLELGDLAPGEWRELTPDEVDRLRAATDSKSGAE